MRERRTLHCYCCGTAYEQGHYRCCAPEGGIASHFWLEKWCHKCGTETHGRCPKHCTCPKTAPEPVTIDNWQNTAKVVETVTREWMPYRDSGDEL